MKIIKKLLKALLIVVIAVVVAAGGLIGWLTVREYRPQPVEQAQMTGGGAGAAQRDLTVVSCNIGYGGLGEGQSFFMDGGDMVRPDSADDVRKYLDGIARTLAGEAADIYLLQEVDLDSRRSYGTDERAFLLDALGVGSSAFAPNYVCPFVPFPLPVIGRVESGLLTVSDLTAESAERVALPVPFSWPLRVANLKRCLLVERIPVEGTDAQIVLINLHLEAYDDGTGKTAQTRMLAEFIKSEYDKGNYVVAGGDFNQAFPGTGEAWPMLDAEYWTPGALDADELPDGFSFAFDASSPTCRLLNEPYSHDRASTQLYVIDGFIVSDNVTVNAVETLDCDFEFSDHNPVRLEITLK